MRPLPADLAVTLDRSVRRPDRHTLIGGSPRRVLRLTEDGRLALEELMQGCANSAAARLIGRRLVDAGIAHPRAEPGDPTGLVTVVIPVRDRVQELERCLAALDPKIAVVLVDDGSRDAKAIAAIADRHDARLVRREHSGGPAAARNAALGSLTTEIVAFLDSDCVPSRDWLAALVRHFEDPLLGAVAPRVRPLASARTGAVGRYLASRSPLDMGTRAAAVAPGGHVSYIPSAALLVRASALDGGFDESLRYGEDVDLVWRLQAAGWRVRYDPAAIVGHEEPATLRAMLGRRFRYGTSAAALARRHPSNLRVATLHGQTLAVIALLLLRRPKAAATLLLADGLRSVLGGRRRGLPLSLAARWFVEMSGRTLLSLGDPAATAGLASCALLALRRRPGAVIGLLGVPALLEWRSRRAALDPLRWSALATLDDTAYALGVWRGAVRHRDGRALQPALVGLTPRSRRPRATA